MRGATEDMFTGNAGTSSRNDEEALVLATLQRSPTYIRARTAVFRNLAGEISLVDVNKVKDSEKKEVLDKLIQAVNEDMELFLGRVRKRFDA